MTKCQDNTATRRWDIMKPAGMVAASVISSVHSFLESVRSTNSKAPKKALVCLRIVPRSEQLWQFVSTCSNLSREFVTCIPAQPRFQAPSSQSTTVLKGFEIFRILRWTPPISILLEFHCQYSTISVDDSYMRARWQRKSSETEISTECSNPQPPTWRWVRPN